MDVEILKNIIFKLSEIVVTVFLRAELYSPDS